MKLNHIAAISFLVLFSGCTSYSTNLNETQKIEIAKIENVKKGKSCSRNLFGAFSLPYFGDTAVKISGDQSVISAIKDADIRDVYAIDTVDHRYILYSKRCTIVFGK